MRRSIITGFFILSCGFYFAQASASSQVQAEGVNFVYSCGYFSNQVEQLHITYFNNDSLIPGSTQMYLHWGLGGYAFTYNGTNQTQAQINWQGGNSDLKMAHTGPGKYEVTLQVNAHSRTEPGYFNQFKFVILQAQPMGTYYDPQGGPGHYYEVDFSNNGSCISGKLIPPMSNLAVSVKP